MRPDEGAAGAPPVEKGRPAWTWVLAVAAALLIMAVGWQYRPGRFGDGPVYRSTETRSIQSLAPEGARLSRANPVLRWTAIEGARYRVRVLTTDLEVLAEADDVRTPEYRLSDDVLRRTRSGTQLLWQVEASVPGSTAVVSPTFSMQVE